MKANVMAIGNVATNMIEIIGRILRVRRVTEIAFVIRIGNGVSDEGMRIRLRTNIRENVLEGDTQVRIRETVRGVNMARDWLKVSGDGLDGVFRPVGIVREVDEADVTHVRKDKGIQDGIGIAADVTVREGIPVIQTTA